MRKQNHSALKTRIIWLWLPICVIIFTTIYFAQSRYEPNKETRAGFERMNQWRRVAGLPTFIPMPQLQKAAENHAHYLSKDAHGHDELNRSNPHFTGESPQERATQVGYPAGVAENLTIGMVARSGRHAVDGLMTAIYHRLSLLNPEHDEAGAAWVNGRHQAFVMVQGSSYDRKMCETPPLSRQTKYILTMNCMGQKTEISLDKAPPRQVMVVKFPIGNGAEPSYNGKELPNPTPDLRRTGNPISIAFYGQESEINMVSFQLFAPSGEIHAKRILSAQNDPNHLLTPFEFVLFPLKPLEFNTEYRVSFRYFQAGQEKSEQWTFRTRKKRHILDF